MNTSEEISKSKSETSVPPGSSCSSKESMQEPESPMLSGLSSFDQARCNFSYEMNFNTPEETSADLSETSASDEPSCNPNEISMQDNLESPQDIPSTVSSGERKDSVTLSETMKSQGKKDEEMSADIYEKSVSSEPSCNPNEIAMQYNLASTQDIPSTVSTGKRKDGATLSETIKSGGKKPVTEDSFADYMRKKFGITSIENLISSRSVTRSGREYGGNPAEELPKKKRSAPPSTETLPPKREPAKRKPAAVPLSGALKNAKPKKLVVSLVPGHT